MFAKSPYLLYNIILCLSMSIGAQIITIFIVRFVHYIHYGTHRCLMTRHQFYSHLHLVTILFQIQLLLLRFILLQFMNKRPEMKTLNIISASADSLNGRTAVFSVNDAGNLAVLNVQT